jgi:cell fate (sporulation/competence/biofilm development) regulator YlbF (YheA/YmcA/DUF963 family)
METITSTPLIEKTRELCQILMTQPEYLAIRRQVEAFTADDEAKRQYQTVSEKGEYLQHKQSQGVQLGDDEVADFEKERDRLFSNPIARGFMDAQQSMHKMQETVSQYVGKTFELGRVPEADDFDSGGCGPTCGCAH